MKYSKAMAFGCASALALSVGAAQTVAAQEEFTLEEITVTATKRAASIKDVPFSINAMSQNDIKRSGAQSLEDLSRNVAGLMIQNLGPGQSQVAIRGVSAGQIVRDQPGVKEQVGIYLDESVISLSLFTPDLDFYDLNRVETLRGPQGTLFGSGSIGGTMRYITNQPSMEGMQASFEGDLNTVADGGMGGSAKGMINLPMSDTMALRAVAYHTRYAGFIDAITNRFGGRIEDVNYGTRTGGRLALRIEPTESLTITPRVIYQEIDMAGFNRQEIFNMYANDYTTPAYNFGPREQYRKLREQFMDKTMIADLTMEAEFEGMSLTSVSSYTDREILVSRDASALTGSVSVDLGYSREAIMAPSNLRDTTKLEQFTQELRLSSTSDSAFQWMIGGFYAKTDRFYEQYLPTPGYDAWTDEFLGAGTAEATAAGVAPADSPYFSQLPYTLEQIAVFGEVSYDVSDQLQVTLGGRYYDYNEERAATIVGLFGSGIIGQVDTTSSNGFTPRLMISYDLNDEITLNAQASKGFRLGGVNDPLNTPLCNADDLATFGNFQAYDDETLWNYEVGMKMKRGALSFNAAAYYTDIKNLQVTVDAGSCSSRVVFNVDKAHTMGLEAEMKAVLSENFDLSLAANFLEAKFDTTVEAAGSPIIVDGDKLPSVPDMNLAASLFFHMPTDMFGGGEFFANASIQYRSSIFTQPLDQRNGGVSTFDHLLPVFGMDGTESTTLNLELPDYTNMDLSVGYGKDAWELVAYVKNVFDTNVNLSFDRERGGRARLGYRTNTPRTIGLTFRYNF